MADDRYTWDYYFQNKPPPKEWTEKGFCPLHVCCLYMFVNLKEVCHKCKIINHYNLNKAYQIKQKVFIHGKVGKSGWEVPPCVQQDKLSGKVAERTKGTVRVSMLQGDNKSSTLVVASCYDQKSFYMISHNIEEITWLTKTKQIYSHLQKDTLPYHFL